MTFYKEVPFFQPTGGNETPCFGHLKTDVVDKPLGYVADDDIMSSLDEDIVLKVCQSDGFIIAAIKDNIDHSFNCCDIIVRQI